jgi:hypothetical protein
MFIGHYAPALVFAVHPRSPKLGRLFVAAQLVDIAFFSFALLGIERFRLVPQATVTNALDLYFMPYTHSLIGTLAFAALWALGTRIAGGGHATAWIGAAVVASHWPLDWLVHAPDLTLLGAGPRHGLALWNWPLVEMPLELGLVAVALVFYGAHTRTRGCGGTVALLVLALALLIAQLVNWLTPQPEAMIDPPPALTSLLALAAFGILAALAGWVAATRRATLPSQTAITSERR